MSTIDQIRQELLEANYLKSAEALLQWDQETYMPEGSGPARADQIAYLSGLIHEKLTGQNLRTALGELIDLESGELRTITLNEKETRLVKEAWKDFRKEASLPTEFVSELAKHASASQQAWVQARKEASFETFQPYLEKMVEMQKRKAEYLSFGGSAYDTLMDLFEPGMTTEQADGLFKELRHRLVPLIKEIQEVKHRVSNSVLSKIYDVDAQWNFGVTILQAIGFDFNHGRQDKSAHPFTTGFHPTDVRTTTRLRENDLKSALLATLHEGGHALYNMGLPAEEFGSPLGDYISLGIHESQSRMWENQVGLSIPFWTYAYPKLKAAFPEQLKDTDLEQFHAAMNKVRPSMIRVEADEATYNLHIMLRFEIEQLLINEDFPVAELPAIWNDKMEEYVGIRPKNDSEGVLQDVHWSFGAFGYFPTYTLGNLYSVQFYNQAKKDIPGLEDQYTHGKFNHLLDWLRTNIHSKGRGVTASELVLNVTGSELSAKPFLDYLEKKYRGIYSIG